MHTGKVKGLGGLVAVTQVHRLQITTATFQLLDLMSVLELQGYDSLLVRLCLVSPNMHHSDYAFLTSKLGYPETVLTQDSGSEVMEISQHGQQEQPQVTQGQTTAVQLHCQQQMPQLRQFLGAHAVAKPGSAAAMDGGACSASDEQQLLSSAAETGCTGPTASADIHQWQQQQQQALLDEAAAVTAVQAGQAVAAAADACAAQHMAGMQHQQASTAAGHAMHCMYC